MKTVVFGDIHGSTLWKPILDYESPDKVIFLGDYFDPYDGNLIPGMVDNFIGDLKSQYHGIVRLKHDMGDNCVLLIGNHDYHYMGFNHEHWSRYSVKTYKDVHNILGSLYEDGDLKFAHQITLKNEDMSDRTILFTHAGVSTYWLTEIAGKSIEDLSADLLNEIDPKLYTFNNYSSAFDYYGNSKSQSPIWIRPDALASNTVENITQIIGHTRVKKPTSLKELDYLDVHYPDIYLIDTMEIGGYLTIEDNKIKTKFYKEKIDDDKQTD